MPQSRKRKNTFLPDYEAVYMWETTAERWITPRLSASVHLKHRFDESEAEIRCIKTYRAEGDFPRRTLSGSLQISRCWCRHCTEPQRRTTYGPRSPRDALTVCWGSLVVWRNPAAGSWFCWTSSLCGKRTHTHTHTRTHTHTHARTHTHRQTDRQSSWLEHLPLSHTT